MGRRMQGMLGAGLLAAAALLAPVPAQAATTAPVIIGGWQSTRELVTQIVVFNKDGSVTGNAGCNDFTASYTFRTKTLALAISPIVVGTKACAADVMFAEQFFLSRLQTATRADTTNCAQLTIDVSGGFMTLNRYPAASCSPPSNFVAFGNARP